MDLQNRTAVVTGGALRIGREICRGLARKGVNVIVHYRSSKDAAAELVAELRSSGVDSAALQADFRDPDNCKDLIGRAADLWGDLDILINSASVFHKDSLFSLDAAKLRNEMQINLEAPTLLMKAFAEQCESGGIVNLLDTRIAGDDTTCIPYLLSKKALAEATRLAAIELAPNFTVNAIAPGDVLPPKRADGGQVKEYAHFAPLTADSTPEHILRAVIFLLEMDPVTGQILFVDSGEHLCSEVEAGEGKER